MKLIVTLTIDIPDPQEWTDAYGAEGSANIRQDVKDYVLSRVQGAAAWDEVDAYVDLR